MGVIWWVLLLIAFVAVLRSYTARKRAHLPLWRTIHDPMMVYWARCVGYEVGVSGREGREPNAYAMLSHLLLVHHRDWDGVQLLFHAAQQVSHVYTFADEELIRAELERRADVSLDIQRFRELFRDAAGDLLLTNEAASPKRKSDNFLLACAIIAEEIEERFGSAERGKYLVEVILGNAR